LALNFIFRIAGIIAHRNPPSAPAMVISGNTQMPSTPQSARPTAPPDTAPMTNWPSAPMFQTPARKPIERPMAIRISGPAFTSSCDRE